MLIKLYVPINDHFVEEVDKRDQHTSLCLKENPVAERPSALREESLANLKRLGLGPDFLKNGLSRQVDSTEPEETASDLADE